MQRDTNRTGSRPAGPAPRGSFSFRRIRSDQAQVHRSGGSRDSRNCEEKTMGYFHPIYRDKHTVLLGVGTIHSHRSEEPTSELQSLMRIQYAGFSLKKKQSQSIHTTYII